jgi:hypothetical protein
MVEHLGLGPDLTVPAWQHAPFCLGGGRCETRAVFDPGGEPYVEATEAMLAAVAEAGVHTVWCGVGGDELMALRPEERGHDLDGDAREFATWVTPGTVDMLLASRDDVAPASVINEVTLMAMACAAPRYLRAGLWTMVPLAHPDLIRFCEWLPQRWRRDKTLMRRYLAGSGLPEVVVHPPLHENLASVMQIGLRQFGQHLPSPGRARQSPCTPSRGRRGTHRIRRYVDRRPVVVHRSAVIGCSRLRKPTTIWQAPDADYRYVGIDTTDLDVAETVRRIKAAIPEVYAA